MPPIDDAYQEVCELHERLMRSPAPEIPPEAFVPFPPGVDPVAYAVQEVSHLRSLVTGATPIWGSSPAGQWIPCANVYASEDRVNIVVEIPGVSREDLTVALAGGELVVRGTRRPDPVAPGLEPMRLEQLGGSFERRFPAPAWCDAEKVSARCKDGVLSIELVRTNGKTDGKISVEAG